PTSGPAAPPPGYGPPAGYGYAGGGLPATPRNGLGTAALVLGIVALLLAIVPVLNVLGLLLAITAGVLGILGRSRARRGQATNGGVALAGAFVGAVAALVAVAVLVALVVFGTRIKDCANPQLTQAQQEQCVRDKLQR
ncbi:MAG: DUF4190 domain-containing protein, partial [Actinomycetota bacterium]